MIRTWISLVPADRRAKVITYAVLAFVSVVVRAVGAVLLDAVGGGVVQRLAASRVGVARLAHRGDPDRVGDRHHDGADRF